MLIKIAFSGCREYHCIAYTAILLFLVVTASVFTGCVSPDPTSTTLPVITNITTTKDTPGIPLATSTLASDKTLQRIIVTNADAAELLLAIGAQEKIVGVSDTVKNHPVLGPRFAGVESIGSWQTPNIETILSLHPDAVISYSSYTPKNIDRITSSGIPILLIDCYKIDTLDSDTRQLGNLTGRQHEAEEYIAFREKYETLVRSRIANVTSGNLPRVYIESYTDYSALTGGTGGDLLVTMAGGSNIAGMLPASSPKVNAEWVYTENPDTIVKIAATGKTEQDLLEIRNKIASRTGIANTSAIRNGKVYIMSGSVTYGPRSVVGLVYVARILHPAEFSDVSPEEILDEYAGRFVLGANTTPAFSSPGG